MNQLAILQAWPSGTTENKSSQQSERELNSGASEIQVHRSNSSEWKNHSLVSNRRLSRIIPKPGLLLWKTVVLTSFQKPQLHYPLQSSSSLSICSSSFPFSVFSIPSFNVLGGYFSCYHLVWWRQFPLLECWQISPVTQFSPLSQPWDYVVLFNWMRCTLFSPSIGVKFELSQFDNPSFNFDLQT